MSNFPTGKPHVSYSEVKAWSECSWRHKLMYIDKLETYEDNPYADFGTAIHEAIEGFLNGNPIDAKEVCKKLDNIWQEKGYDSPEYIKKITDHRSENGWRYTHENLEAWKISAINMLNDLPDFLDQTFPGWKPLKAEQELYEAITDHDLSFKGFIDCVIMVPKSAKSDKVNFWILDWKTTSKTGWYYQKKKEFLALAQIGLYKSYWSKKFATDLKDIRTGYVFLKRGAPPGKTCELFKVSTGPKFIEKTEKLVDSMIKNVRKGFTLKNYNSCKFCSFKGTEHCSGPGW